MNKITRLAKEPVFVYGNDVKKQLPGTLFRCLEVPKHFEGEGLDEIVILTDTDNLIGLADGTEWTDKLEGAKFQIVDETIQIN